MHPLLIARLPELSHVVSGVPITQLLVEAVQPRCVDFRNEENQAKSVDIHTSLWMQEAVQLSRSERYRAQTCLLDG